MKYHLYIGPFVVCENALVERERIQRGCDNRECENRRGVYVPTAYCGKCGEQIRDVSIIIEEQAVRAVDVVDDLADALCNYETLTEATHYVPNGFRSDCPRDFYPDDFVGVYEGAIDTDAEMEWLTQAFVDELMYLRNAYGADKVRVSWGILGEYI